MGRYLIQVPHAEEKRACAQAIRVFMQSGSHYLMHADWGCGDGEHCGWLIVETPTREDARRVVPPAYQAEAKIVALRRFDMEELDAILDGHPAGE